MQQKHKPRGFNQRGVAHFVIPVVVLLIAVIGFAGYRMTQMSSAASASFNDTVTGTGQNQFNYAGKWATSTPAGAYSQNNHYTGTYNNTYTFKFTGTQIKVYAEKNKAIGVAAYSVDGGAESRIDGYSGTRQDNVLTYTSPVLASGQHTLKVRVTSEKNRLSGGNYLVADRVEVVTNTPTTPPTPPTPPTPTPTPPAPTPTPPTPTPTPPASGSAGCAIGSAVAPCIGGPTTAQSGWTLAFSDEFNGSALDLNKWESTWFGEGSTMNNAGTYASNVSVSGGEARLQLSASNKGSLIHTGYKSGHYQYPVGSYLESRIYFPGSSATKLYNWPAFWANSTNNYPASGEHDIAEVLGTGELTVNYHSPSGSHNQGGVSGNWGNSYHTYGILRSAKKADVYWDGRLVKSYTTDDDGKAEDIIYNVGSGKGPTMTGAAGAMRIDYVRAWKK